MPALMNSLGWPESGRDDMLNNEIESALNRHLNAEFFSSYLYLSMAAYFDKHDLPGMLNWMKAQSAEENTHALKFYKFILDRDGKVALDAIERPPNEWSSPLEAFENAYKHEQEVSSKINVLLELSLKHHDHATHNFLQWFVAEQVEEEATVRDICSRLKLVGNDGRGLFLIDQELAARGPDDAGADE